MSKYYFLLLALLTIKYGYELTSLQATGQLSPKSGTKLVQCGTLKFWFKKSGSPAKIGKSGNADISSKEGSGPTDEVAALLIHLQFKFNLKFFNVPTVYDATKEVTANLLSAGWFCFVASNTDVYDAFI